ncbi:MAG: hypothetical protein AAGE18_00165 [Pseudomonadota bacterium]
MLRLAALALCLIAGPAAAETCDAFRQAPLHSVNLPPTDPGGEPRTAWISVQYDAREPAEGGPLGKPILRAALDLATGGPAAVPEDTLTLRIATPTTAQIQPFVGSGWVRHAAHAGETRQMSTGMGRVELGPADADGFRPVLGARDDPRPADFFLRRDADGRITASLHCSAADCTLIIDAAETRVRARFDARHRPQLDVVEALARRFTACLFEPPA